MLLSFPLAGNLSSEGFWTSRNDENLQYDAVLIGGLSGLYEDTMGPMEDDLYPF